MKRQLECDIEEMNKLEQEKICSDDFLFLERRKNLHECIEEETKKTD